MSDERYIEFAIHPRGIGYGGPGPLPPFGIRDLTNDELTNVGMQLYGVLTNQNLVLHCTSR